MKGWLLLAFTGLCHIGMAQSVAEENLEVDTVAVTKNNGETEDYRRSSLCLLLITNLGDKYAKAIEEQFLAMPLPARYNGLNVSLRVLDTSRKKTSEKKVTKLLEDKGVAKELVGKWFNRDYSGRMNMQRIHDWGGYNATFADLKRAQSTERGLATLTDEGEELIKNTFVLVCDISYYDKANTGAVLSGLFAAAAATMDGLAQQQANKGNYSNAQMYSSFSSLGTVGSVASQDIAGFSVNIMSYLYRLQWSDKLRDQMYSQYWVDETTAADEAQRRRAAFDNDNSSFKLEYLGKYRARSGKTVSKSANNLNWVIRQVCADAVDKGINNLAKMYPVFKPKTTFSCEDGNIYAYIGTKEGVTQKSKYEVLETVKKKKGAIEYKKVATVVPVPGNIWDNKDLLISSDSLEQKYKGTMFRHAKGRRDICGQGLTMREAGKLGYQYKKHRFYVGVLLGTVSVPEDKIREAFEERAFYNRTFTGSESGGFMGGYELGWVINFRSHFAWNVLTGQMGGGGDLLQMAAGTGIILRTNPWGKNGRWSLFVWPTLGVKYASVSATCTYSEVYTRYHHGWNNHKPYNYTTSYYTYGTDDVSLDETAFDWNVKVGMNITERFHICANISEYYKGASVGYFF
ncbi:MAG: hypothetical protein J6K41_11295 [Paraprevotella sp.]|nr:hypothetical protein [Paraprevotella sp.]